MASCRLARTGDVDAVASGLADAFDGDPWSPWIVAADRDIAGSSPCRPACSGWSASPQGEVWLERRPSGPAVVING